MSAICSITRSIRSRIAVLAVAGIAALGISAGVAQATDYSSFNIYNTLGGTVSLDVNCDLVTHKGTANLFVFTPPAARYGFWIKTQVHVKGWSQPWSSAVTITNPQQFIAAGSAPSGKIIGSHWIAGRGEYMVGVSYSVALPGGQWSEWMGLLPTTYGQKSRWDATFYPINQCLL